MDDIAIIDRISRKGDESAETLSGRGGLEVVSIAKSYDRRPVLTDVSLTVAKG
jgi:lipopolysaccharide export system ATP-binding protein